MRKRFNFYYVISVVTLVFMLFLFYQNLLLNGWFGSTDRATRLTQMLAGIWRVQAGQLSADLPGELNVMIDSTESTAEQLEVNLNQETSIRLKLSNFEEDQILMELFKPRSDGYSGRLEGCEILLREDDAGHFQGATLGELCAFSEDAESYSTLSVQIFRDSVNLAVYTGSLDNMAGDSLTNFLFVR